MLHATRSMIYKDTLYKDQDVPSTEALLSEWRHRYYMKDTEILKKNKRFAVLKQFLIILIEHTACTSLTYLYGEFKETTLSSLGYLS